VVVAPKLNVRGGPGTGYPILAVAIQGDAFVVKGQNASCAWLQVVTPQGKTGWVSGATNFVLMNLECSGIAQGEFEPPPTPAAPRPGLWLASSDFGSFTFTVNADSTALTEIAFSFSPSSMSCTGVSGGVTVRGDKVASVNEQGFTFHSDFLGGLGITVKGAFNSATRAAGTWQTSNGCSGPWQATHNG
jgi:hypothetical protein